jgi:hypothetical protein
MDHTPHATRRYLIADPVTGEDFAVTVTHAQMSEVNDPEVMADLESMAVGQTSVLGMCDAVRRVA